MVAAIATIYSELMTFTRNKIAKTALRLSLATNFGNFLVTTKTYYLLRPSIHPFSITP